MGLAAVAFMACESSSSVKGPPPIEPNTAPPESPADQQASVAFFDDSQMHEVRL